jgi:hypothetical protein
MIAKRVKQIKSRRSRFKATIDPRCAELAYSNAIPKQKHTVDMWTMTEALEREVQECLLRIAYGLGDLRDPSRF